LNCAKNPAGLIPKEGALNLIDFENVPAEDFAYGAEDARYGKAALEYIDASIKFIQEGLSRALVTAPVNKASIACSGAHFQGHTEYIAARTFTEKFAMMLLGERLRVTLVTRHMPLRDVSGCLTENSITSAIELTYNALRENFKIRSPRIGVAGINPHAGDSGLFGQEEAQIISPAIKAASVKIKNIFGPRPPDVIFHEAYNGRYDAVVAMYHDQGLIPLKMLYFETGVNLTLGLPFIRTSPDHGSAFDIAGRLLADHRSMLEAMKLAERLAEN
jgi:4-hydroxythreonine-4-phosphate dehydrogenase